MVTVNVNLYPCNINYLRIFIFQLQSLAQVAEHTDTNKMTPMNLGIVIGIILKNMFCLALPLALNHEYMYTTLYNRSKYLGQEGRSGWRF